MASSVDVLEELLLRIEAEVEVSALHSEGEYLAGFVNGLDEVRGFVREALAVERLGE